MVKKIMVLLCGLSLALAAGGCNTIAGLGQDVQKGGESIEKSANKNR